MKTINFASAKDLQSINSLLRQLNPEEPILTKETLVKILSQESYVKIIIVRDSGENNQIFGMASLHIIRTLFGLKGIIENVVVDEKYRGRGLGKQLISGLIEVAKKKGIKQIELTSSPKRHNANKMYKSIGFKKHKTNVYRLKLKEGP